MEIDISLDENTSVEDDYAYPINILRTSTKKLLSSFLNPSYCLPTDDGIYRDWEGLINITGDPGSLLYSIRQSCDPTQRLLDFWLFKQKEDATIDKILSQLKAMDRYDVLEDILHVIAQDIHKHKSQEKVETLIPKFDILTIDDAVLWSQKSDDPQFYDAFILFSQVDIKFVEELITILEGKYKLKLCVTDRDLEAGVLIHESTLKLIADRCNKLIVVMSTELFENPVNLFFCNFGVKIGMENNKTSLIGCIHKECNIPRDLNLFFMLDMKRISKFGNFWEKLRDTIRPVELKRELEHSTEVQQVKIKKASRVNKIKTFIANKVSKKRREDKKVEVETIEEVQQKPPKKKKSKLRISKEKKSKVEMVAA